MTLMVHRKQAHPWATGKGAPMMDTTVEIPIWEVKRVLERHAAQEGMGLQILERPQETAQELGVNWRLELLRPLLDTSAPANELCNRYKEHVKEQNAWRDRIRQEGSPSHPRYRAWRERQIRRANLEIGGARNESIIHAPAAYELAVGCSVGCWFCGISAGKLSRLFEYTAENAALWNDLLRAHEELIGPALRWAFCYWGTDPLDNPDYEKFCLDLWRITGVFPQTTTALALKNPARTRQLLEISQQHDVLCNRFSLLTLRQVLGVHQEFTPEELQRTELIPQNKESILRKAEAGKARDKDREPLVSSTTIACVTGLLVNMCERTVRLVTPCKSDERWRDGFQVRYQGQFDTAADFLALVRGWFDSLPLSVEDLPLVRPGRALSLKETETGFSIGSELHEVRLQDPNHSAYLRELGELIGEGRHQASTIATLLSYTRLVAPAKTMELLESLFSQGGLDEEAELWDR